MTLLKHFIPYLILINFENIHLHEIAESLSLKFQGHHERETNYLFHAFSKKVISILIKSEYNQSVVLSIANYALAVVFFFSIVESTRGKSMNTIDGNIR